MPDGCKQSEGQTDTEANRGSRKECVPNATQGERRLLFHVLRQLCNVDHKADQQGAAQGDLHSYDPVFNKSLIEQ